MEGSSDEEPSEGNPQVRFCEGGIEAMLKAEPKQSSLFLYSTLSSFHSLNLLRWKVGSIFLMSFNENKTKSLKCSFNSRYLIIFPFVANYSIKKKYFKVPGKFFYFFASLRIGPGILFCN